MQTLSIDNDHLRRLTERAEALGVSADALLDDFLSEDLDDLRQFFVLSTDMLCVLDAKRRYVRVNHSFSAALGYRSEELLGRRLTDFIHPDDQTAVEHNLLSDWTGTQECRYRHRDGTYRWLSWGFSLTDSGRFYAIARDITDMKQYQQELLARNEELDAFAYSVAHDVKNPIASMMGFASLLISYLDRMDKETIQHYAEEILAGGYQAKEIVDSILLLARVRQADLPTPEPMNMMCIVEVATERLRLQIIGRSAIVRMPDQWPDVVGYRPWIEQVWINYISNAIKYGGTPPVIEMGADEIGDDCVRFWVKDNGRGLDPEEQERLFKPFTRLNDNHADGHGLGLSIVSRIIEKLGGTVGVESVVGKGSRFYFTLPREGHTNESSC